MQFLGYKRADGKIGVRNHVLILPACACASETCRIVASQVKGSVNVIINVGCSDVAANTEMTQRILTGFALNANVYGVVIIGLGCETVGHRELKEKLEKLTTKPIVSFGIQEEGGTVATAEKAVRAAREMVAKASLEKRVPCDASDLFVAIMRSMRQSFAIWSERTFTPQRLPRIHRSLPVTSDLTRFQTR